MASTFDLDLQKTAANFTAVSPLQFIERSAQVYPDRLAVVHGQLRRTWAQTYERSRADGFREACDVELRSSGFLPATE